MRPGRRAFLAGCAAALAVRPAGATDLIAPFRRGVSIHNLLNWAEVEPADKARYRFPPFSTPQHRLKPEILDNIRKAGFDFVRLTVDPGPFLQFSGAQRDDLYAMLLVEVRKLSGRGFGVIVDFHPTSQVAAYAPENLTASQHSPLFKAYLDMLVRAGRLLAPVANQRVALELMNEPQYGWDAATTARWQTQQKQMHDAVRAVAPELTLILTGAQGGSLDGLIKIDPSPFKSSNVLWSLHYYEPYLLTHQGVSADNREARLWRYFSDLPYPAAPEMFDAARAVLRANILGDASVPAGDKERTLAEAEKTLRAYLDARPGRARVAADFARLDAWAQQHAIALNRVILGEFGITRTYGRYRASAPGTLANWLADVRQEAEKRGMGWAFWALSGYGGMSLIEQDDTAGLDAPTVKALGLTAP